MLIRDPGLLALALAAFLLRGGAFLLVVPIVALPSTVDVAVFFGANAVTPAGPSAGLLLGVFAGIALFGAWLSLGWIAASAFEIAAAQRIAGGPSRVDGTLVIRAWTVRLVCLAPLILVLWLGAPSLGSATYNELVLPGDLHVPLLLRIVLDVPLVTAAAVTAWLAGELIGGIALRRIALGGASVAAALGWALALLVRRPIAVAGSFGTSIGSLVVANGVAAGLLFGLRQAGLESALAWDRRIAVLLVVLLAAAWVVALALMAAGAVLRSTSWTLIVAGAGRSREPSPTREAAQES